MCHMYRDLWLLIYLYDLPVSKAVYAVVQILGGTVVAALTGSVSTGWPEKALLTSTLGLAVAWMMLLGPATESSSFVLLAPPLAWSLVEALRPRWDRRRMLLAGGAVCFLAAVVLGGFSTRSSSIPSACMPGGACCISCTC